MYRVKKIAKQTWQIEGIIHEYMYLVEGDCKALLIDTGMGLPGLDGVVERLTDKPVMVMNTHGHFDHVGGNYMFDQIYRHPADQDVYLEHTSQDFLSGVTEAFLKEAAGAQAEVVSRRQGVAGREKRVIDLPEVYDLGGRRIEVIATPGHTSGSVCLLDTMARILFSGDTVCDLGIMLSFSHSTEVSRFIKSIRKLQQYEAAFDVLYPGHHRTPIEPDYLREYIECGKALLRDQSDAVFEQSVFGSLYRKPFKRVHIAYTEDKLN